MFAELRAHANIFIKLIENSKFGVTKRNKVGIYIYCSTEKLNFKLMQKRLANDICCRPWKLAHVTPCNENINPLSLFVRYALA